jgi:hypothetical protein
MNGMRDAQSIIRHAHAQQGSEHFDGPREPSRGELDWLFRSSKRDGRQSRSACKPCGVPKQGALLLLDFGISSQEELQLWATRASRGMACQPGIDPVWCGELAGDVFGGGSSGDEDH